MKIYRIWMVVLLVLGMLFLVSCGAPPDTPQGETYTVTWQNYDGTVLESDTGVEKGTVPAYHGETPARAGEGDVSYRFTGWSPLVGEIYQDTTYTAQFEEVRETSPTPDDAHAGVAPVFSQDGKTVQYGIYPQTHVGDAALVAILETLTPTDVNGWYLYEGVYYAKVTAEVYSTKYKFDDGTPIVGGETYWFRCDPITWHVLKHADGRYVLMSAYLLDTSLFYGNYQNRTIDGQTVYANNYLHSDVRSWLNATFADMAFALSDTHYLVRETVDNSAGTSDNTDHLYSCSNTSDKVYLPSYRDTLSSDYGFNLDPEGGDLKLVAKTTDYARTRGAWCNTREDLGEETLYCGTYWTRTPASAYSYCAWNVNSGGHLSAYAVDGDSHCVRPCITLSETI